MRALGPCMPANELHDPGAFATRAAKENGLSKSTVNRTIGAGK